MAQVDMGVTPPVAVRLRFVGALLTSLVVLPGGCDLAGTIRTNTMAIRKTTSTMQATKGSIDHTNDAIRLMIPALQKAVELRGPLADVAALKDTMQALAQQMDRLTALEQSLVAVAKLKTELEEVAALRAPLQQVSKLQPELKMVGDLRDPLHELSERMVELSALDQSLRRVVELREPLIDVSHLKDPLTRTANLAQPLNHLSDLADQVTRDWWLLGGGLFVLCTGAMALGAFIGVRVGLRPRPSPLG